jgi:hypothetical protein
MFRVSGICELIVERLALAYKSKRPWARGAGSSDVGPHCFVFLLEPGTVPRGMHGTAGDGSATATGRCLQHLRRAEISADLWQLVPSTEYR